MTNVYLTQRARGEAEIRSTASRQCHSTADVLVAVVTADAPVSERTLQDQGRTRGKGRSVVMRPESHESREHGSLLCWSVFKYTLN